MAQSLGQCLFCGVNAGSADTVLLGLHGLNRVVDELRSGGLVENVGKDRLPKSRSDIGDAGENKTEGGGSVFLGQSIFINLFPGSCMVDE